MATFEDIVNSAGLEIIVPDTALGFPTGKVGAEDWLTRVRSGNVERKLAFFGMYATLCLTVAPQLNSLWTYFYQRRTSGIFTVAASGTSGRDDYRPYEATTRATRLPHTRSDFL